MKPYTVVLDLDGTAVWGFYFSPPEPLPAVQLSIIKKQHSFLDSFEKHNLMFFVYNCWYMIFPGFIELLQWLDHNQLQFAFFSLGSKSRNMALIPLLLARAFGEQKACKLLSTMIIVSKEDAIENSTVKDLRLIHKHCDRTHLFSDVVILDDNPASIHPTQSRQFIRLTFNNYVHFHALHGAYRTLPILDLCCPFFSLNDSVLRTRQLFYAAGLLSQAIEKLDRDTKLSLSEMIFQLSSVSRAGIRQHLCDLSTPYIEHGLRALKQINPSVELPMPKAIFDPAYILPALAPDTTSAHASFSYFQRPSQPPVSPPNTESAHARALEIFLNKKKPFLYKKPPASPVTSKKHPPPTGKVTKTVVSSPQDPEGSCVNQPQQHSV